MENRGNNGASPQNRQETDKTTPKPENKENTDAAKVTQGESSSSIPEPAKQTEATQATSAPKADEKAAPRKGLARTALFFSDTPPHHAGPAVRWTAFVVDWTILVLINLALLIVYGIICEIIAPSPEIYTEHELDRDIFFFSFTFLVSPFLWFFLFWRFKGATPGGMLTSVKVVDAKTLERPSDAKLFLRTFVMLCCVAWCFYFFSTIDPETGTYSVPLFLLPLFFLTYAEPLSKRPYALWDLAAGTSVIRNPSTRLEPAPSAPQSGEAQTAAGNAAANQIVTRGRPMPVADAIGWLVSLFPRLLLQDTRVGNRRISPATEEIARKFMARHGMADVAVRLNDYAPRGEFERLASNNRVSGLGRFLFGLPSWYNYLFFPGRAFASSDYYNPFSHSVHLFSDVPAIALHELGHALDYSKRRFPTLYALFGSLPLARLWQEYVASRYAIEYLREIGDTEGEKEAWPILSAAFCTYIAGYIPVAWLSYVLLFPFVMLGHMFGKQMAMKVRPPQPSASPQSAAATGTGEGSAKTSQEAPAQPQTEDKITITKERLEELMKESPDLAALVQTLGGTEKTLEWLENNKNNPEVEKALKEFLKTGKLSLPLATLLALIPRSR